MVVAMIFTSAIAAAGTTLTILLGLPAWMMFMGWIAFGTSSGRVVEAPSIFICLVLGLLLGWAGCVMVAQLSRWGVAGVATTVFVVTGIAVLTQFLPTIGRVTVYFIGITAFFASQFPPAMASFNSLGAAGLVGICSGVLSAYITRILTGPSSA